MDKLKEIWEYLQEFSGAFRFLFGSGIVFALMAVVWRIIVGYVRLRRARLVPLETFPFDIIPPQSDVLEAILKGQDDDPLADQNIPYQKRIEGRSIRKELEQILDESRWVLIRGRTGLGKTREAALVAQSLNNEGWTILNLTREGWLEPPGRLPQQLKKDRKLIFFLDDLNRKMYASRVEKSPRADNPLERLTVPLQERLNDTLETYENLCGKGEVRVIATTRDETIPEYKDEPPEWEKLEYDKYSNFWSKFIEFNIPEPKDRAVISLLDEIIPKTEIVANSQEYHAIAKRNDKTFANVIENLRMVRNKSIPFKLDSYRDSLKGTWEQRYQELNSRYPAVVNIYDAIELLQGYGIALRRYTIEPTARFIANGNIIQQIKHWWEIRRTILYLINRENILTPQDGQIEAKGRSLDMGKHLPSLHSLILKLGRSHPRETLVSLIPVFWDLFKESLYNQALMIAKENVRLSPQEASGYYSLGGVEWKLNRNSEAIKAFMRASDIDPEFAYPHNGLGNVYIAQRRYKEALAA
ncbi:MAG: hypothetical protein FVQ83_13430, partial [Chloroflexi bacterium]|nr:hypothetical protein [Chloroflexota bacterium]